MIRYRDSGSADNFYPGVWFDANIVEGIQAFRGQFGFFRFGALRKYGPILRRLSDENKPANLVLGSNSSDPLTAQDLRLVHELLSGGSESHLTVVTFSNALFHPKVMHINDVGGRSHALVGSPNLTEQALGRHVEAWIEIDQGEAIVDRALADIVAAIDRWHSLRAEGVFQIIGTDDIETLLKQGIIIEERTRRTRFATGRGTGGGGGRGSRPTRWMVPKLPGATATEEETDAGPTEPAEMTLEATALVDAAAKYGVPAGAIVYRWSKKLTDSDVNKNPGHGRNRLVLGTGHGHGRVMGHHDDIRTKMMADAEWSHLTISGKEAEEAQISFLVSFPDEPISLHRLAIKHAPHRVFDQANPPTSLHWNHSLARVLRSRKGPGFTGYWGIIDKYENGAYTLTISRSKPNPIGLGLID